MTVQMYGGEAAVKVARLGDVKTILDVGSGQGHQAEYFRRNGKNVFTIGLEEGADYVGEFLGYTTVERYDCVWCCHCLEHFRNVGLALEKMFDLLRDDGVLALTVPPGKVEVVGGHVNLFVPGTLLYNVILAGFDCSRALVSPLYVGGIPQPYNLSLLVRKKKAELPALAMDAGDIEKLASFFPMEVFQGFNGVLPQGVNWEKEL